VLIKKTEKILERCPLKYKPVQGLSSLDPSIIFHQLEKVKQRFGLLLEALYINNRITDSVADKSKAQYTLLCSEANSILEFKFKIFLDGDCPSKRLDDFFLLYYLGTNVMRNCGKLLN